MSFAMGIRHSFVKCGHWFYHGFTEQNRVNLLSQISEIVTAISRINDPILGMYLSECIFHCGSNGHDIPQFDIFYKFC